MPAVKKNLQVYEALRSYFLPEENCPTIYLQECGTNSKELKLSEWIGLKRPGLFNVQQPLCVYFIAPLIKR